MMLKVEKPKDRRFIDIEGKTFGRLKVISYDGKYKGSQYWKCKCSCGKIKRICGSHIRRGLIVSCGCYKDELTSSRATTHGMRHTTEYQAYAQAKGRCTTLSNKAYHRYGGRGIEFKFKSFQDFINHVGKKPTPKHSLDRIDNDGNYEPGNVRWADKIVQMNNRGSYNHPITYNGITKNLSEWARDHNILPVTLRMRLYRFGWSIDDALNRPIDTKKSIKKARVVLF